MGLFGEAIEERRPVFDAVVGDAEEADVGGGSDEALLQVLAKAVVDGEGDDEGSHAGGYSDNRDAGDDADKRLAALGAQVAGRDEEFKAHGLWAFGFRLLAKSDYNYRLFDACGIRANKKLLTRRALRTAAEGAEVEPLGLICSHLCFWQYRGYGGSILAVFFSEAFL